MYKRLFDTAPQEPWSAARFNVLQFDIDGKGGVIAAGISREDADALLQAARISRVHGRHVRAVLADREKPLAMKHTRGTPRLPRKPRLSCDADERTKLLASLVNETLSEEA